MHTAWLPSATMSRSLLVLALTLLFISCDAPEARVEVALITDAVPGVEFHFVELDLLANGTQTPRLVRSARVQVATGDVYREARTVTRFLPITPGSYHLDARLVARDGVRPVLSRNLDVDVLQDMRIVIRLDRACISVECPGSGDSGASECVGGRCEDPTCASSPLTCPTRTGCASAADCPRASTCSTAECVDGVCFTFPNAGACPETSYCDAARGCVPYDGADTCGMPCTIGECGVGRWSCAMDGTMTCEPFLTRPPGEPCGDGVCDEAGDCAACVPGAACDTGNACEVGTVDCSTGRQVCVGAGPRPSGTECRAAAGVCDSAEVCDGASVACPSDARVSAGTECRAAEGDCDVAEVCDGTTAACPSDALRPSTDVCRASTGACDTDERCDGMTPTCPADARASAGTTCRAAAGDCDSIEICDGASAVCPSDALRTSGSVCRAAASSCDVQEVCSGTSNTCPIDAFVSIGSACTAGFCNGMGMCLDSCTPGAACSTGNPCEVGRTDCSTGAPRCLPVGPGNAGAVCRPAAGPCDVDDTCSGTSTVCADARAPATVVCRAAAAGGCDRAEMCDGRGVTCPLDTFLPAATTCRAAVAGGCDVAETCSGTTAACPADRFAAASVVCRASAGFCDVAETCSGTAAACPANAFQPATLSCRASVGACDAAESCTGSAAACPADALLGPATTCRASTGFCDPAEVCSGTLAACPGNAYQPVGTTCSVGQCDAIGVCAITRDCTHRWRNATDITSNITLNASAQTALVAGFVGGAGPRIDAFNETTGAIAWTRPSAGSFGGRGSSRYVMYQDTGGSSQTFRVYDMLDGTPSTTFSYGPNTNFGQARYSLGINHAGTASLMPAFAPAAGAWSTTAGGMALSGTGPTSMLIGHSAAGAYTGRIVYSATTSTFYTPIPLYDGRWAIAVNAPTTPMTFGSHTVAAGSFEVVVLTPTLTFDRVHLPTFPPQHVAVEPGTNVRIVSDGTGRLAAFNDAGLIWSRADCGGFIGASAGQVIVASSGSTTFCGVPTPSGGSGMRIAVLNAATGATISTRTFPASTTPSLTSFSNDGDVYFYYGASTTICGMSNASATILAF